MHPTSTLNFLWLTFFFKILHLVPLSFRAWHWGLWECPFLHTPLDYSFFDQILCGDLFACWDIVIVGKHSSLCGVEGKVTTSIFPSISVTSFVGIHNLELLFSCHVLGFLFFSAYKFLFYRLQPFPFILNQFWRFEVASISSLFLGAFYLYRLDLVEGLSLFLCSYSFFFMVFIS